MAQWDEVPAWCLVAAGVWSMIQIVNFFGFFNTILSGINNENKTYDRTDAGDF